MTRTSKEIRAEIAKLHDELRAVEDSEAKAKYSNLEGKWIKFSDQPWYDDEEEERPRIQTYAKLAFLKHVTPVSSDTDEVTAYATIVVEFGPYYGGVKFVYNEDFDHVCDYDHLVEFASNRYQVITDADVIKAVNEATVAFEVKTDRIKTAIIREESA